MVGFRAINDLWMMGSVFIVLAVACGINHLSAFLFSANAIEYKCFIWQFVHYRSYWSELTITHACQTTKQKNMMSVEYQYYIWQFVHRILSIVCYRSPMSELTITHENYKTKQKHD